MAVEKPDTRLALLETEVKYLKKSFEKMDDEILRQGEVQQEQGAKITAVHDWVTIQMTTAKETEKLWKDISRDALKHFVSTGINLIGIAIVSALGIAVMHPDAWFKFINHWWK